MPALDIFGSSLIHGRKTRYQKFVCDVPPPHRLTEARQGKTVSTFQSLKPPREHHFLVRQWSSYFGAWDRGSRGL